MASGEPEERESRGQNGKEEVGEMERMKEAILIINQQIQLLIDWNKEHIETEPEQVRKNIETILQALKIIHEFNH